MRFSPGGDHLLGGVGAIGVFVDGRQIATQAGGWDWLDPQTVMGPGGYDSPTPGLYRYPLPSGPQSYVNAILATNFYSNGMGSWVRYLADGYTGSTDSAGNSWPDRIALGFEGTYQIFTDTSWIPLIFRDITTGIETVRPSPGEWEVLPDGSTYFSRNYRGIFFADVFWACGYQSQFGGLCIWRPFALEQPTYLLSTDLDFNPDINKWAAGSDSYLVVGSGQNQGETAQHLYEINLSSMMFCRDGGPWQPMTPAVGPTPEPLPPVVIAPFSHPQWVGPYFATGQYGCVDHNGNCEMLVRANFADMVRQRAVFADLESAKTVPDGMLLGIYASADEGGVEDANLQQAIDYAVSRNVPSLIYVDKNDYPQSVCDKWLNDASGTPIPNRIPCVQAYPAAKQIGEPLKATPEEDVARIYATVQRLSGIYARVAIAHTYYTQSDGTRDNYPLSHILSMCNGLGDLERELAVFASLGFSRLRTGGGDMSRYPELLDAFDEECAATPGAPSPILLPVEPEPEPPEPEPQPPEPEPEPPEPEPEPPEPEPEPPKPEPEPPEPEPEPPQPEPLPPQPEPEPEPEPMPIAIGQKGQFRLYGSKQGWTKGIVCKHQDETLYDGKPVIVAISTDLNVDPENPTGNICCWTGSGHFEDTRTHAGGGERTSFDGRNLMVARPDDFADVFEWVNIS